MVDLELDVADHMGVGKTDWQFESGEKITVNPKRAVLIKSILSFLAEQAGCLEHIGA